MFKIKVITIGKTKESWLQDALEEYHKRLKSIIQIEWILLKNEDLLPAAVQKEPSFIALDPKGKLVDSVALSHLLFQTLEKEGSRLAIVIGGAEGISSEIKQNALFTLSLSPLTFTHQLTRLILLEQIYRAYEIKKGSSYHK